MRKKTEPTRRKTAAKKPARAVAARETAAAPAADFGESIDFAMREAGSPPNEAVRAYLRLHYASGIIMKKVDQHLAHWGLSVARYSILRLLLAHEAMTLSHLSKSHVCVAGNMTALIGRLERDGLVRRMTDADDKRVTWVALTAKGRTLTASAVAPHHRFLKELMSPLTSTDVSAFIRTVDTLVRQANAAPAQRD